MLSSNAFIALLPDGSRLEHQGGEETTEDGDGRDGDAGCAAGEGGDCGRGRGDGAIGGAVAGEGEVGAGDAGGVCKVESDGTVTKERTQSALGRGVGVDEAGREWRADDLAVFAAQVTNLAGLGKSRVARRHLTTLGGIEMTESAGAVAIRGYWLVVDMVEERSTRRGQAGERHGKGYTGAIGVGDGLDGATDGGGVLVGQGRSVSDAERIISDDGSVSQEARNGNGVGLGGDEGQARESREEDGGTHSGG